MQISDEAVEAAAKVLEDVPSYDHAAPDVIRMVLEAAAPYTMTEATKLIRDLSDPDPCQFDHHGGCQAHGYLSLEPGETCPQQDAKEWVREHG